ncbi:MAG: hydroxyacid dehydrogenase [Anaerolinea sp.]|nr:hydroxyacid dehydrogenase [Anaerolinea sp.]
MTTILVSHHFAQTHWEAIARVAAEAGLGYDILTLPADPEARLSPEECARADIAFFSGDIFPRYSRGFFAATAQAPNLKWVHVFNAGVDNPVFRAFLDRGIRLTTSSGSTAKPIAQTAIGGLLMLARRFPTWGESQRRHAWEPIRGDPPPDLDSQTMVVLGVGAIGNEIARLARAIGLRVVGVRRSQRRAGDNVDELIAPPDLLNVLPRADWLALACPLTPETRGVINAETLATLPRGAHIINIARGEVVDEPAMIAALRSGHLGGAYLDVVSQEPLPADSPLWDIPNVIISPHNSAIAAGNEGRTIEYFLTNLRRWAKGEALVNEVTA